MRKSYLTLFAASALLLTACGESEEKSEDKENKENTEAEADKEPEVTTADFSVDSENSTLEWTGYKVEKPDYKHVGMVDVSSGNLSVEMKGDEMKVTGGTFTVDLTTIREPGAEDPKMEEKLVGHLSSPDFFNVSEYAKATFTAESHDAENNVVNGKISVLGQEIPASIESPEMTMDGDKLIVKANFSIDFSPLSMPGMQAKEGKEEEKISESIKFSADLVMNKM